MSLRSSPALRGFVRYSARRTSVTTDVATYQWPSISSTTDIQQHRLYAHQSYGGGEGNPKGENPQEQGPSQSTSLEHPGPPPPSAGQGTGGGPTKAREHGQSTENREGTKLTKQPDNRHGAKPAIHSEDTPAGDSEEVKKHNEELEKRHDRASNKVDADGKDNVGKGFWSGQGGADREQ